MPSTDGTGVSLYISPAAFSRGVCVNRPGAKAASACGSAAFTGSVAIDLCTRKRCAGADGLLGKPASGGDFRRYSSGKLLSMPEYRLTVLHILTRGRVPQRTRPRVVTVWPGRISGGGRRFRCKPGVFCWWRRFGQSAAADRSGRTPSRGWLPRPEPASRPEPNAV